MRILADQNMPLVEEYFSNIGEIERFAGRDLSAAQLQDTDILLVRSITEVNHALLSQANKLKFVGTATIGTDHIDQALLAERGIAFSSAPGCNAVAVAEYVISSLLALAQEDNFDLRQKTVGIVGVGNIGSLLQRKLAALGVNCLLCDPPKAQQHQLDNGVSFEKVINDADIISFHVPLVKSGPHKTTHLVDQSVLKKVKKNAIIINSCRGDVIDNQALLSHMKGGAELSLVLDVWENEPNINTELLEYVRFGSVHIAGHTLEGKARGTEMLYQAVCRTLARDIEHQLSDFLAPPAFVAATLSEQFSYQDMTGLVHHVYDVRRDFALMTSNLDRVGFDTLRKTYPGRREFSTVQLTCNNQQVIKQLSQLGFSIKED